MTDDYVELIRKAMDSNILNVCRLCTEKMELSCIFTIDGGVSLDVKAMACAVIHVSNQCISSIYQL